MSVSLIKQKTQALPGFWKVVSFARKAKFYIMTKLRNPNSFILKIGRNFAFHYFGDVTTDTAFFLGKTGTMDTTT